MIYPWHTSVWKTLDLTHLPHALLIHGAPNTGKTQFALALAHALLCENPSPDDHACGQCAACGWLNTSNHPDFFISRPESFEEEAKETKSEESSKGEKSKSREIKIEQIRELIAFVNIGTHRAKSKVVLLYPLETLNIYSANALLKILEEPPADTLFILLANHLDRVLPTVLSRCQRICLPAPRTEEAIQWLREQGVQEGKHFLQKVGGAPLEALALSQNLALQEMHQILLEGLSKGREITWLKLADNLHKHPLGEILLNIQRWGYDLLSIQLTQKIRYFPAYENKLKHLSEQLTLHRLLHFMKELQDSQKRASHPLSSKLVLENCFIQYTQLFK